MKMILCKIVCIIRVYNIKADMKTWGKVIIIPFLPTIPLLLPMHTNMSLTVTIVTIADEQLLPTSTRKHPKKYYAEQSCLISLTVSNSMIVEVIMSTMHFKMCLVKINT